MQFEEISKFKNEFKKFKKKYKSLDQDLEKFKEILVVFPCGNCSRNWAELTSSKGVHIFKARFSCAYLKNKSLRLIYAYYEDDDSIEFLEVYFKGDKDREDKERIAEYLNSKN